MKGQEVLFMLKLDGLTTKLIYEDGRLIQASTRGDGEVGEDITHNIPAFLNVPLTIPHKERLVITGESFIPTNDFERLKDTLRDGNGKPYKNGRNFASGSVRSLDPKNCIGRCVRFLPFNVLEGMEDVPFPDSRACKLEGLTHLGFGYCPFFSISGTGLSKEYAEKFIQELVSTAANLHLPIDGIVMIFDSLSYSKSCGKTGHHYKDGLAYKFEDDTYETFLREIEWTPTRFGEIAPVGIFDTVEIDGCDVSRASLHNLTFIKNLELVPGCRILVSKRNMIIPHIEDNLDRGKVVETYLNTKDVEAAQKELVRIIRIFLNESMRYFDDITDISVFTNIFLSICRILLREKKGLDEDSISEELQKLVTKNYSSNLSKATCYRAINWLYHSGIIGFCGKITELDILNFKPGSRCFFMDLGVAYYYLSRTGATVSTMDGSLNENYVYINLSKRQEFPEEIIFETPAFATYKGGEIDFVAQTLKTHIRYLIEVKAGKGTASTALKALEQGKANKLLYLKGDTKGGTVGNVQTLPIYLLEQYHF